MGIRDYRIGQDERTVNQMTKEEKLDMFAMRLNGYTLQEIGEKYGISKERVRQIMESCTETRAAIQKIVYPAIRDFMSENKLSITAIANEIGIAAATLKNMLFGITEFKMRAINGILYITGLSYEEAFRKPEEKARAC